MRLVRVSVLRTTLNVSYHNATLLSTRFLRGHRRTMTYLTRSTLRQSRLFQVNFVRRMRVHFLTFQGFYIMNLNFHQSALSRLVTFLRHFLVLFVRRRYRGHRAFHQRYFEHFLFSTSILSTHISSIARRVQRTRFTSHLARRGRRTSRCHANGEFWMLRCRFRVLSLFFPGFDYFLFCTRTHIRIRINNYDHLPNYTTSL